MADDKSIRMRCRYGCVFSILSTTHMFVLVFVWQMHLGCVVVVVGQRRVKDIIRWTSVIDLICGRRHVFDVASSERGWRVAKKVTERNNKSALGRITGKYRDRPGLVQLFVACYYRNVELLKKIVLPVLDWSRESGLAAAAVVVVLVLLWFHLLFRPLDVVRALCLSDGRATCSRSLEALSL